MMTLEEQQRELTRRLEEVRARHALLGTEQKAIEAEIAQVKTNLDTRRRLPMARTVIASPCDVPWSAMKGDDRSVCVRLFERVDGTILTADCPVGVKRRRTRGLLLSVLGAGACALFAFTGMALLMVMTAQPPLPRTIAVPGPTVLVPTIPTDHAKLPSAPRGTGWLLAEGPAGTRVYEGEQLLGVVPFVVTLPAGSHVLRAEGSSGRAAAEVVEVQLPEAGRVAVAFKAPVERRHTAGIRPPRNP